jgi:diacylglycerol kinase (ATP)
MIAAPMHDASDRRQVDSRALKGRRGLQRVLNATRYSIDGLREAWTHEDAFRQEVVLAAVMIPRAAALPVTLVEKILLAGGTWAAVLLARFVS